MNIWVLRTVKASLNYSEVMGLDIMIRYNELEEIKQLFLTTRSKSQKGRKIVLTEDQETVNLL